MAGENTGGRLEIEIGAFRVSARGKVSVSGNTVTRAVGVNSDGTNYKTVAPKAPSASVSLERGKSFRMNNDMILADHNITIREIDVGITHLFTGSAITGDVETDLETGEVTGFKIEGGGYQEV